MPNACHARSSARAAACRVRSCTGVAAVSTRRATASNARAIAIRCGPSAAISHGLMQTSHDHAAAAAQSPTATGIRPTSVTVVTVTAAAKVGINAPGMPARTVSRNSLARPATAAMSRMWTAPDVVSTPTTAASATAATSVPAARARVSARWR